MLISDYLLDVLWGQPIKLIQVAFNSELRENQWNNLLVFENFPCHFKHKIGHNYFTFNHAKKLEAFFNH